MAAETPAARKGQALGTLATGSVTGTLVGPLVGGLIAGTFGYRSTFLIAAMGMALVFTLTLLLVREDFKPLPEQAATVTSSLRQVLSGRPLLLAIFIVALTVQSASTTIQPIVSLFVAQLTGGHHVDALAGLVTAAPGLAALLLAPIFGRLADRLGATRVLHAGLWGATLTLIPLIWVHDVWWLVGLRFVFGISDAAIIPAYQAIMAEGTRQDEFGRVFSYSQSFQAAGNVVGPILGALCASAFGYGSVFALTLLLELGCLVLLRRGRRN